MLTEQERYEGFDEDEGGRGMTTLHRLNGRPGPREGDPRGLTRPVNVWEVRDYAGVLVDRWERFAGTLDEARMIQLTKETYKPTEVHA